MTESPERLAGIRTRDPVVLEAVAREALPGLLRAARAAGLSPDRAEDAVQSALLVFVRRAEEFDGRARATTWMHGILFRTIAAERRALGREADRDPIDEVMDARFLPDGRWATPPAAPDRELSRAEFRRALAACLEQLPPRQRSAFLLREVEDRTTDEACKILDVSANNMGVMLFRARNRLRECLEAGHGFGGRDVEL